jgi:mannose/cellobiose epimerase-like protein (N-acyl-D-glucosamine 2-epimerase family)
VRPVAAEHDPELAAIAIFVGECENRLRSYYGRAMTRLVLSIAVAAAACSATPQPAVRPAPRIAASELPSLERWRQHVTDEILPFWVTPDALGTPIGNFPTFRCNDGTVYRPDAPCAELARTQWIVPELGRDYTRMKSRQTYLYGVAFHITGDERYLEYARAGVAWLRANAYERDGGAVTYWSAGTPGPPPDQRTSQDLAYAQVGLAFYYYLTRDPEVLADLLRLERHIMTRYWEASQAPPGGMLRWVIADGDKPGEARRQELVAQLDQINAYLLLLAPLLEDNEVSRAWRRDLVLLARVVKDRYFAPEHGMFWGAIHDPELRKLGSDHTDFGHSIKSMWMLYLTGQLTGDRDLVDFARPLIAPLLARAAQPSGCWASGLRADGDLDRGLTWWTFAELDQAAATLAGREPSAAPYARYLPASYACWFTRFVDPRDHDVWPFLPDDWPPEKVAAAGPPKVFHWKNGYHVMEHALVALITTAGLTGQRLALYYAFAKQPPRERIQPYYFAGAIADERDHPLPRHPGLHGRRVEFTDLH